MRAKTFNGQTTRRLADHLAANLPPPGAERDGYMQAVIAIGVLIENDNPDGISATLFASCVDEKIRLGSLGTVRFAAKEEGR